MSAEPGVGGTRPERGEVERSGPGRAPRAPRSWAPWAFSGGAACWAALHPGGPSRDRRRACLGSLRVRQPWISQARLFWGVRAVVRMRPELLGPEVDGERAQRAQRGLAKAGPEGAPWSQDTVGGRLGPRPAAGGNGVGASEPSVRTVPEKEADGREERVE